MKLLLPLIAFGLVFCPVLSKAQEPTTFTIEVPAADKLAIRVPTTWIHTVIPPTPDHANEGPMAKIVRTDKSVMLQLAFFPDPKGLLSTQEAVDHTTKTANMRFVSGSVEGRQVLVQLTSDTGHGSYATFTDGSMPAGETPKPGKYRDVLSGIFVIGKQAVSFTILSNGRDSQDYRDALEIVTAGITVQK